MRDRVERAESLLATALVAKGSDPNTTLEGLIRGHPELESELRDAWADHERAGRTLGGGMFDGQRWLHEGEVFGDFELVRLLGQGGQAWVWEAEQSSLGRRVALKLLRPDCVHEDAVDLLRREARAMGRLGDPGIVPVYQWGCHEDITWVAQELIPDGRTLADWIDDLRRAKVLRAEDYREIAIRVGEIARALQVAHDRGVVHRDVKPSNVLVTPNGQVKVADFGLARVEGEDSLSPSREFLGTYFYMSPEQVAGSRAQVDHRTDVFSLGVVLYELLTLRRPFEGDRPDQITHQVRFRDPVDPRTLRSMVPKDLALVCLKAIEKSRARRYASMAEFQADLERFLDGRPVLASPPSVLDKAVKWVSRHPALAALALVTTVGVVTVTTLLVLNAQEVAAVERLSALQDYDRLIEEAEGLWPPHPENIKAFEGWILMAEKLADSREPFRERRDLLQEQGEPVTPTKRPDDLIQLQRSEVIEREQRAVLTLDNALRRRRGEAIPPEPQVDLDSSEMPTGIKECIDMAFLLVRPGKGRVGMEGPAIALAEHARQYGEEHGFRNAQAWAWDTLALAYLSLGRDEEALSASRKAEEFATGDDRERILGFAAELRESVRSANTEESLRASEEELHRREARLAELKGGVAERVKWQFDATDSHVAWWYENVSLLVDRLDALVDSKTGLLGEADPGFARGYGWTMRRRLEFAEFLRLHNDEEGEFLSAWEDALPQIRERYEGIELEPQVDIVPIGRDPDSGLWEFWHPASGTCPERIDGKLVPSDETGLVFVLIPGGSGTIGSSKNGKRNPTPLTQSNEKPVHDVELSPFFLSKFEMTQAQWLRLAGERPSSFAGGGEFATLSHPVESVSWIDCQRVLPRFRLVLPTEAQWEYAARAGTQTPWWTGAEPESLLQNGVPTENIHDYAAEKYEEDKLEWIRPPGYDDGAPVHAAVGSFPSNPFGLHDMLGNVSEICRDGYHDSWYWWPESRRKDAYRATGNTRVERGGHHSSSPERAVAARRVPIDPNGATYTRGVRPARLVERH